MEKKIRLRGPNFTKSENFLLCDIVTKYKDVIENKKTDGANLQQKHAAWLEVVEQFNASTTDCQRTLESLQQNYKNLKKKLKKSASDAKMKVPVDILLQNLEEFGTSPDGWENVANNVGAPRETCQVILADLKTEADGRDRLLKKNAMGTGGGPASKENEDPLLEKVKVLVGPTIDGLYTIYDGDSGLMASQSEATPIEAKNIETGLQADPSHSSHTQQSMTLNDEYFTNDRTNLKKQPHHLLTRKRKLESEVPQKQSVSMKFSSLATENLQLVAMQKELLQCQLIEENEKLAHNRLLRAMEIKDAKKRYEHNELIRKLELDRINK